ncbi:uncharacterized protein METZ01_LOCUS419603 [marine metagenome]|uniref:Uncharacterized protein n=1 Tax=marine metagenome TaxID=408172 RepID=A0A382X7A1_9ZZZZ
MADQEPGRPSQVHGREHPKQAERSAWPPAHGNRSDHYRRSVGDGQQEQRRPEPPAS